MMVLPMTALASQPLAGKAKSLYKPQVIGGPRLPKPQTAVGRASIQGGDECPSCDPLAKFDEENFSKPTKINSKWLPLKPGTQLVLQGVANRGGGLLPHHVIFTVTDLVKDIEGIPCVVVWDQDINEGVLSESELAFFAQDDEGNVWLFGEYPEEYEDGVFFSAENTWISGIENAEPGVIVPARPEVGTAGFRQGFAPENDFWDCGMVDARFKEKTCVPFRCYRDITVVKEWAPLDGCFVIQVKTYAKHVGVIEVGAIGDPEGETLVLVDINRLDKQAMAEARAAAIALDTHGYEVNEHYALTTPVRIGKHGREEDLDEDRDMAEVVKASATPLYASMSVGPNPVAGSTEIAYGIAQAGRVELGIFDIAGRRVRSLVSGTAGPGTYRVQWDRRDEGGQGVAPGVYFARLRTDVGVVRKTLVVTN